MWAIVHRTELPAAWEGSNSTNYPGRSRYSDPLLHLRSSLMVMNRAHDRRLVLASSGYTRPIQMHQNRVGRDLWIGPDEPRPSLRAGGRYCFQAPAVRIDDVLVTGFLEADQAGLVAGRSRRLDESAA